MDDDDLEIVSERTGTKRVKRESGIKQEVIDLT